MPWRKSDRLQLIQLALRNARICRLHATIAFHRDALFAAAIHNVTFGPETRKRQLEDVDDENSGPTATQRPKRSNDENSAPNDQFVSQLNPEFNPQYYNPLHILSNVTEHYFGNLSNSSSRPHSRPVASEIASAYEKAIQIEVQENMNLYAHFLSFIQSYPVALGESMRIASSFAASVLSNQGVQGYEIMIMPHWMLAELVGGVCRHKELKYSLGPHLHRIKMETGRIKQDASRFKPKQRIVINGCHIPPHAGLEVLYQDLRETEQADSEHRRAQRLHRTQRVQDRTEEETDDDVYGHLQDASQEDEVFLKWCLEDDEDRDSDLSVEAGSAFGDEDNDNIHAPEFYPEVGAYEEFREEVHNGDNSDTNENDTADLVSIQQPGINLMFNQF